MPDPYEFQVKPGVGGASFDYFFTTLADVPYVFSFTDEGQRYGAGHFSCQHYSVDLLVVGAYDPPPKTKPDTRIRDTIQAILAPYFDTTQNVLITVCDYADGREATRFRKFTKWFAEADAPHVERHEFVYKDEDQSESILSAVFVHADLPNKGEILKRYEQVLFHGS